MEEVDLIKYDKEEWWGHILECKKCNHTMMHIDYTAWELNFCSNCGCKLDFNKIVDSQDNVYNEKIIVR